MLSRRWWPAVEKERRPENKPAPGSPRAPAQSSFNQSISQPTNQPTTNQPVSQPINQSITRLPDYPITRFVDLEVELQPDLQHARSHDLLYAAEVGDGQPGRIERGLTRVAAGDRSVADLARAGVERVMQLDDERRSTRAVDLEALVRAQ